MLTLVVWSSFVFASRTCDWVKLMTSCKNKWRSNYKCLHVEGPYYGSNASKQNTKGYRFVIALTIQSDCMHWRIIEHPLEIDFMNWFWCSWPGKATPITRTVARTSWIHGRETPKAWAKRSRPFISFLNLFYLFKTLSNWARMLKFWL